MKRKSFYLLCVCLLWVLAGCKQSTQDVAVEVPITDYQRLVYDTTTVRRGDIIPEYTLSLTTEGYEVFSYSIEEEREVKKIHVKEGEVVKKGQCLVTFRAEELEERLISYQEERKQQEKELKHLKRLQQIDASQADASSIKGVQEHLDVVDLYIKETKEQLKKYELRAKQKGVVTKLGESLLLGKAKSQEVLLQITASKQTFEATVPEGLSLKKGMVLTAVNGYSGYAMKVMGIRKETEKTYAGFKPLHPTKEIPVTAELEIHLFGEGFRDVLYVEEEAILVRDGKRYVYTIGEDGYRRVKEVTVDRIMNHQAILRNGIKEGEKVVIP